MKIKSAVIKINGDITNYLITDTGEVINTKLRKPVTKTLDRKGHYKISLWHNNRTHTMTLHQLVAKHFLPNPTASTQVIHINGDMADNSVENLRWKIGSASKENGQSVNRPRVIRMPNRKYYEHQIRRVCKYLEEDIYPIDLVSRMTEVDRCTVSNIKHGRCWTHVSSQYKIDSKTKRYSVKYHESKIRDVCKLLENGRNGCKHISEITGVGISTVYRVMNGQYRRDISCNYYFPKRSIR